MSNVLKIRIHAYVSNNNKYLKNPEENDIEFINLPTDSVKITTDKGSVDKNKIKDVVNEVLKKNKFVGGKRYKRNTLNQKINLLKNIFNNLTYIIYKCQKKHYQIQ